MSVALSRPRLAIPPNNLGQNVVAQRKIAEAAGRAAERARIAVSVDSFPARIWLRNLRGTIQCPCSSAALGDVTPLSPNGAPHIILDAGEGDDEWATDSGFPLQGPNEEPGESLPGLPDAGSKGWVDELGRLLLGDGRRCGLCWGTGWIDGHRLWGGQRFICAATSNPWVECHAESSTLTVDLDAATPTLVGPGSITWSLSLPPNLNLVDALRVRDGLRPAISSGWSLSATTAFNRTPSPINLQVGDVLAVGDLPTTLTLVLEEGVRVSHVELVLRSEPLVNVQLPNLQMAAGTELVQPFMAEEFEVDPVVGWLERGSIFEIPGMGGRLGSVWLVTDVTENRTAPGVVWNITGNVHNVQPADILACVSLEDALLTGSIDPGLTTRGLESTGAGVASGLNNVTDDSLPAVKSNERPRKGGGSSAGTTLSLGGRSSIGR